MARSNLFYRVLTAIILIPIVLILIFYSNEITFFLILSLFVLLADHELFNMFNIREKKDQFFGFVINFLVLFFLVYYEDFFLYVFVAIFFIILLYALFIKGINNFVTFTSIYLLSVIYIPFLLSYVYKLFLLPHGRYWLLFLLLINWATDSFAYFVGIKFGKHKFSQISPKKSIEGVLGGVFGGVLVSLSFNFFFLKNDKWLIFVLLGILGSIVGQISDLVESGLKRSVGVKDSGTILPGHGGVLDRLDSMFFTSPLIYFFGNFIIERL